MDLKLGALLIITAQICTAFVRDPCACGRNFSLVCGSDGEIYSNECELNCAAHKANKQITVAHQGPCKAPQRIDPATCGCKTEFNPVCGNNERTYDNECALNCDKTRVTNLWVAHRGECDSIRLDELPIVRPRSRSI